jgi:hypothetical protein
VCVIKYEEKGRDTEQVFPLLFLNINGPQITLCTQKHIHICMYVHVYVGVSPWYIIAFHIVDRELFVELDTGPHILVFSAKKPTGILKCYDNLG